MNKRLMWYLERNKILMEEQAGFRQFRSTEDQIAYIAQTIEDGYQRQQHTATVWVDMEKAFDKVWKKGLVLQQMQAGVSHNMLKWIEKYLSQRTGRVSLQGKKAGKQTSRWGSLPHTFPGLHEQHPEYHQASCKSRTLCR